jgi:hypothetical protein
VAPAFRRDERGHEHRFAPLPWATGAAVTAVAASLLLGIGAGVVWPELDGPLALGSLMR